MFAETCLLLTLWAFFAITERERENPCDPEGPDAPATAAASCALCVRSPSISREAVHVRSELAIQFVQGRGRGGVGRITGLVVAVPNNPFSTSTRYPTALGSLPSSTLHSYQMLPSWDRLIME